MDLFNLFVRIVMKDEATEQIEGVGEKLKSGLATAGKVAAAGIGIATAAVTALTKACIDGYSEYEQLTGGVETLFGTGGKTLEEYAESVGKTVDEVSDEYNKLLASQKQVIENAAAAYKTAGMDANEYMNTVTSFAASLLQSVGDDTVIAAEKADMAITDMSDNANKMGTDISMIQNAYQGFAKANYTMLDNLKLGYGGTQEEMKRLLADAEAISGIKYDISSYADIVDAIHVIQTEMGITGTTAAEASETISGSIASMRAAWRNLVVGMADDNQDLDVLVDNFVESVGTAGENLIPRIEIILGGIGELIERLAPVIASEVPSVVASVMPSFVSAGMSVILAFGNGIAENSDEIIAGIVTIIEMMIGIIGDNLPEFTVTGIRLIGRLAIGLIRAIPDLIMKIPDIIRAIVEAFGMASPEFVNIGADIVRGIWEGITKLASWLKGKVTGFFGNIVAGAKETLGIHSPSLVFAGIGENMALGVGEGWNDEFEYVRKNISEGMKFEYTAPTWSDHDRNFSQSTIQKPTNGGIGPITINMITPDGKVLASYLTPYISRELAFEQKKGW
ncbi:MAG: hypothetical protein II983_06410 [Firmicutes bacterium]|nr:hypothetical protein [Bacillota bacterium]MBQ6684787.1 hypothetical protein [Bacillota bacterium]